MLHCQTLAKRTDLRPLLPEVAMRDVFDAKYCSLHVRETNRAAIGLYRDTLGFTVNAVEKGYCEWSPWAYFVDPKLTDTTRPMLFSARIRRRRRGRFGYATRSAISRGTLPHQRLYLYLYPSYFKLLCFHNARSATVTVCYALVITTAPRHTDPSDDSSASPCSWTRSTACTC